MDAFRKLEAHLVDVSAWMRVDMLTLKQEDRTGYLQAKTSDEGKRQKLTLRCREHRPCSMFHEELGHVF